jgi:hypothetical protein
MTKITQQGALGFRRDGRTLAKFRLTTPEQT